MNDKLNIKHISTNKGHTRYFVAPDGVIHSLFPSGASTYNGHLRVTEGTIKIIDSYDSEVDYEVLGESTLWDSLTALAAAIEGTQDK